MARQKRSPSLQGMKKAELIQEIRVELAALRSSLKESLHRVEERMDGNLASLEALVQEQGSPGSITRPPRAKVLRSMLREIRQVKLKPHRGRLRDLSRIQRLCATLWDLLPPED